jgi:hypothetical protein
MLSRFFSLLLPLPTAAFSTIMAKRKATAEELEAQAKSNGYKRGARREKDSTRDNGKHNMKTKTNHILFSESLLFKLAKGTADEEKVRQSANQMVEDWRRGGKPWSEIIRRFDYGILLFIPSELTDER